MLTESFKRITSKTPIFFQKVRNIATAIATSATSAAVFYPQLPANFQELIPIAVVKYIAVSGFVAAFVSQLTKTDNPTPTT